METTTCRRGFSVTYIPDKKLDEVMDFQFLEGGDLERMWKLERRERLKLQEEKIWDEFVKKDRDVLQTVIQEDKYQFIENIPEDCLKELIQTEVVRSKQETEQEQAHAAGDSMTIESPSMNLEEERDQLDIYNFYDEEKDGFSPDDDGFEEVEEVCTVRERMDNMTNRACGPSEVATERNSETNMTNMIESSIYCAKVKNLRAKIREELLDIIPSIENLNLRNADRSLVRKQRARAAEYAARFQRIHLYQLTRHVHDLERHNVQALPFAKHTHFQSQMFRIVALHTSTLQAIQVFHKSIEHTACLCECADQLRALCAALKGSIEVCKSVSVPHSFCAAKELYNDDLQEVCDQVEKCVLEYADRVADIVRAAEDSPKIKKSKLKKKTIGSVSRNATKNSLSTTRMADPRLSMYSLETVSKRRPVQPRRDNKGNILKKEIKKSQPISPRSLHRTPRSRRPLMRAPVTGGRPGRRDTATELLAADHDLHTMVEAVDVTAGILSNDPSPTRLRQLSPHSPLARQTKRSPYMARPRELGGVTSARSPRSARSPISHAPRSPRSPISHAPRSPRSPISRLPRSPRSPISRAPRSPPSPISRAPRSPLSRRELLSNRSDASATHRRGKIPALRLELGRIPRARGAGALSIRDDKKDRAMPDVPEAPTCDVTTLLRQLCGGDGVACRGERVSGAKNAQLLSINSSGSPRQPTTPQLLRILEETIQKKEPKPMRARRTDAGRLRLTFNTPQRVADHLFQYRREFVQHMLASSMYANSAVGKPWEVIGSVADQMLAEILVECAWEMELLPMISQLYLAETQDNATTRDRGTNSSPTMN